MLINVFFVYKYFTYNVSKVNDIQGMINNAYNKGEVLILEPNKHYYVDKTLNIKTSIVGNNAVIEPLMSSNASVMIMDKVSINNLNFKGDNLKAIIIKGNDVNIAKCSFISKAYDKMLLIEGNNLIIKNSIIKNMYIEKQQYAIRNVQNKAISGFKLINSEVYGGIRLTNEEDKNAGDFLFLNNRVFTDYSHVEQNFKKQHDAFRLGGVKNILIEGNTFELKNVNRGFKFTDYLPGKKYKISKRPVDNIKILNNVISSHSINGKQLFDLYDGTARIEISNNKIESVGHTVVFEDKTTFAVDSERCLEIKENNIKYDFRILYYRGKEKENVSTQVCDNVFIYSSKNPQKILKRVGQEKEIVRKYMFYFRTLKSFNFQNNIFLNIPDYKVMINIVDVKNGIIKNSDIVGKISYKASVLDQLIIEQNHIWKLNFNNFIRITRNSSKEGTYKIYKKNNKEIR